MSPRDDRDYDDDYDDVDIRRREEIPNYLAQAIMVTLCCCMPLGIVSIVQASKVNGLVGAGRYNEAREASEQAKKWAVIGLILQPIFIFARFAAENPNFR